MHATAFPITVCLKVPIHVFINGTDQFPIYRCAILCKFKEISGSFIARQLIIWHTCRNPSCRPQGPAGKNKTKKCPPKKLAGTLKQVKIQRLV